jgi:hypothetical protein
MAMARAPKILASVLLALVLQACTKGYPAEDAPLISPFDMHNGQRLAALNQLGKASHRDREWSFSLAEDCQLKVAYKRKGARLLKLAFELDPSMDVDVAFDEGDQTYDVHLLVSSAPGASRVGTVLESTRWTNATQADLLLQLLMRDCGIGGGERPPQPDQ